MPPPGSEDRRRPTVVRRRARSRRALRGQSLLTMMAPRVASPSLYSGSARLRSFQTRYASAGLLALVFGLTRGESDGWGDPVTAATLIGGGVLLSAFVALQRRVAHPL